MSDRDRLTELYRNGLRIGIRRGSGSNVATAFKWLWKNQRKMLIDYDLRMIALDEMWGSLLIADDISNRIQGMRNSSDSLDMAFAFVKKIAMSRGNRAVYYLTRVLLESSWILVSGSSIQRQIPKKEWLLAKKAVTISGKESFWGPLLSACGADKDKKAYVSICSQLDGMSKEIYEKMLCRAGAIMAVCEPAFPEMHQNINSDMIKFNSISGVSWNFVHPDSYLGGKAISTAASKLKVKKSHVRRAWLYKYVDQAVNPERSFWQSVYETSANAYTKNINWHMIAVVLMSVCQESILNMVAEKG